MMWLMRGAYQLNLVELGSDKNDTESDSNLQQRSKLGQHPVAEGRVRYGNGMGWDLTTIQILDPISRFC